MDFIEYVVGHAFGNPHTYIWFAASVAIYIRGMKWADE